GPRRPRLGARLLGRKQAHRPLRAEDEGGLGAVAGEDAFVGVPLDGGPADWGRSRGCRWPHRTGTAGAQGNERGGCLSRGHGSSSVGLGRRASKRHPAPGGGRVPGNPPRGFGWGLALLISAVWTPTI